MAIRNITLTAALVLPFFAGCAQLQGVPSAEPFEAARLKKAKSAQHWDVIARDVAAETAALRDKAALQGKPLHVLAADGSSFSRAFQTLLVSRMVNQGLDVSTQAAGAITVRYEAQVVRHPDNRGGFYAPGSIAALAGGVLVAREIDIGNLSYGGKAAAGTALIAATELGTAYARLHSPTNTEVLITTSLIDGTRYLMRKTDVYYVEDVEGMLFERPFRAASRAVGVVGQ